MLALCEMSGSYLQQAVFYFDIIQLVCLERSRNWVGQVVLKAKDVSQTGKHWLCCKCKALPAQQ